MCQEGTRCAYLNASTATLAHGVRDSSPWRVNHGDEPHEAEVFNREIHIVRVELEPFRILFVRQEKVAETCKEGSRGSVRTAAAGPSDSLPLAPG